MAERFVRPEHRAMVLVHGDPEALLDRLEGYAPPAAEKWIDEEST